MRKIVVALLLSVVWCQWSMAQVGTWKAYLSYHDVTEVEEAGNLVYVLASNGLYLYNRNDQSIETYDKANVLNDCQIAHIKYCKQAKRLVIVYENENIDLMDNNSEVTNISDYYTATMTEEKTVNSIDINGNYAYLSTGFGIVKLNVSRAEISDTYKLGFSVNYSYIDNGKIYAASASMGLFAAPINSNLVDPANWNRVGDYTPRAYTIDEELQKLVKTLEPGGPKYNRFGFMKMVNGALYTCGGVFAGMNAFVQVLQNKEWSFFQEEGISEQTGVSYQDFVCLDVNPLNRNHVVTGGRNGVYEFENGKFLRFHNHENNSLIESFNGKDKEYELVTGIIYDKDGNLWMLNSQAPTQSLIEYTKEGEWVSKSKPELMKLDDGGFKNKSNGELKGMFIDSRGLMWFVNNHWDMPALYCYQISTDAIKAFEKTFRNEDNTSVYVSGGVRCVTEDKDHNIWIGTNVGPLMLKAKEITSDNPIFTQVKVPRNDGTNYADYLLDGVDITCIAVDGGGRKWFGTNGNGVYLISEDNYTQIHHFMAENSSLFSNYVEAIAIDDQTGEVFFGTDKGLCSYMSDATETNEVMTTDNVYAYPNPVRPDYTGLITVTGLSYQADVKIVTSNGVLVAEGKSNGGTFTWDGCDRKGKRVASGVYMVQTATSTGEKGTVCKIAVVN